MLALLGCDPCLFLLLMLDLHEFLLMLELTCCTLVFSQELLVLDICIVIVDRESAAACITAKVVSYLLQRCAAIRACKIN